MNIWNVLGITATEDKNEIKKAYRNKLRQINPEDEQEKFMELRDAYEQALNYEQKEDDEETGDAITLWVKKLEKLYSDNARRFLSEEWEAVFAEDVCFSLDTREDAGIAFLNFFGEHTLISRDVARKAEEIFQFSEKMEEVTKYVDQNLVEYFLYKKVVEEEYPLYRFFAVNPIEDGDYNEYIRMFGELCRAYNNKDYEAAKEILAVLDESEITHPYVEIKRAYLCWDDKEAVEIILENIEKIWGKCDEALFVKGELFYEEERYEEAENVFRKVLEISPEYLHALYYVALCLKQQKKYIEAKKEIYACNNSRFVMNMREFVAELEDLITEEKKELVLSGQGNDEDIYELAVSLYNRCQYKEAGNFADMLQQKPDYELKYLKLKSMILLSNGQWEQALEQAKIWFEKLKEDKENTKDLANCYNVLGTVQMYLGMKKEALENLDKGIELSEHVEEDIRHKVMLLRNYKFYELAADECSKLIEKDRGNLFYLFLRGVCYYYAGALRDSLDDFNEVCSQDNSALVAFIYRARIFLKAEMYEDVAEILKDFEETETDTDAIKLIRGMYHRYLGNWEEAKVILEDILANYNPEDSDLEQIGEVYFHLFFVYVCLDMGYEKAFACLNEGLEKDPLYTDLWVRKAILYLELGDVENQEKTLQHILKINPYERYANRCLADIYAERGETEKAEEIYAFLEFEKTPDTYIDRAYALIRNVKYKGALYNIDMAEKLGAEPAQLGEIRGYYYHVLGDYDKAKKGFVLCEENGGDCKAQLATLYCHQSEFDKAKEQYQELVKNEDAAVGYGSLFTLELRLGNFDKAKEYADLWLEAVGGSSEDTGYQMKMGEILTSRQNYEEAKIALQKAAVDHYYAHDLLGSMELYWGDPKEALSEFEEARKQDGDDLDNYYLAALAYKVIGDEEGAKRMAERGLLTAHQITNTGHYMKSKYKDFASFYSILGDMEKAKEYFDKSFEAPICVYCKSDICHEVYLRLALFYHFMGEKEKVAEAFEIVRKTKPFDIDLLGSIYLIEKGLI